MELFKSDVASISYVKETGLIHTLWKQCRNAEDFMPVVSQVMEYYRLLLPRKTLWDQTHFNLHIPPALQEWTEENINIPAQQLNVLEKVCFIVSKDTMSQMSVMEIFDESTSGFVPRYFVDENESRYWLDVNEPILEKEASPELPTILIDKVKNKVRLSIEIDSEEFNEYLYLFNKLWKTKMLSIEAAQKFLGLTNQEKNILRLLLKGKTNDSISEVLSISPHTVKTHRKNIYRKLGCKSIGDLMPYSSLF